MARLRNLTCGVLLFVFVLGMSLVSANTYAAENEIPPLKIEEWSGIPLMDNPFKQYFFNGEFDLGPAGVGNRNFILLDKPGISVSEPLVTVEDPEIGACLKIPTSPKRLGFELITREVFIPENTKVTLGFKARINDAQKFSGFKHFGLELRRVNAFHYGIKTNERYWCRGVGFTPTGKWNGRSKTYVTPKGDYYYRITLRARSNAADEPLPDIFVDSIKVDVEGRAPKTHSEVALYADKELPIYNMGESVNYDIKASIPGAQDDAQDIAIDIVDDQFLCVEQSISGKLSRVKGDVFAGKISFKPNRYGSFSCRVRVGGNDTYSVGGDFSLMHPVAKELPDSIASRIAISGDGYGYTTRRIFGHLYEKDGTLMKHTQTPDEHNNFKLLQATGIRLERAHGFIWSFIEKARDKFDFTLPDNTVENNEKYGIRTLPVLGPSFFFHKGADIPDWLRPQCTQHEVTPEHATGGPIPPMDRWKVFCKALMSRYKGRIKLYEVLNEPNGGTSVSEYMEILKTAYEATREVGAVGLIGPCPTGDGKVPRFADWSKGIIAAGGEKYIEGFSYHPYGAGNDFQKGEFFKATQIINDIRSWLNNKDMPLYNTEDYYLYNKDELGSRWTASAGLRHYLLTLGNDVRLCAAFHPHLFIKDLLDPHVNPKSPRFFGCVPSPVCAAFNNMSWNLKNVTKAEVLKLNGFVNSYVFSGAKDGSAVVALWDLRPGGSSWASRASADGLVFTDMWGNAVSFDGKINLTLEPMYVLGGEKAVREFMAASSFVPAKTVDITGRVFGNDLWLSSKNMSGLACSPEIMFAKAEGLSFPQSVQLAFADGKKHCTVCIPGALGQGAATDNIKFAAVVDGNDFGSGVVSVLPKAASYDVESSKPVTLDICEGAVAKLTAEEKFMRIEVSVRDGNVRSPTEKFGPWTGSALEVYVDCAPFDRMEQDLVIGSSRLPMWQYAVPAKPAADSLKVWTSSKSEAKPEYSSELTDDGYKVMLGIPWEAIKLAPGHDGIYGLDFAIDFADAQGKTSKKSLSGRDDSWKRRLHYPLFRFRRPVKLSKKEGIDEPGCIYNGSLEEGAAYPAFWDRRSGSPYAWGDFGYNGSKGLMVELDSPMAKRGCFWKQAGKCERGENRLMVIECLAKASGVKASGDKGFNRGILFSVHFYDGVKKKHLDNKGFVYASCIKGDFDWKIIQSAFLVPKDASDFHLHCGLQSETVGAVVFDNIKVKTYPLE